MVLPFINWKDKYLYYLLLLALGLGFLLRAYRLSETFDFNGDLGRDALVAKRIIVDQKLTLIGPRASGGDFYLGPFYYYFIIPPLVLFGFSPLGPVYLTILFALLTIILVYLVAGNFFSKKIAIVAAFLYAVSPPVVAYSRTSGNYTLLPFFSLLSVFFLWRWLLKKKLSDFGFLALFLGLSIQLHYSAMVLIFFSILVFLFYKINPLFYRKHFLLGIPIFGLLCSPLLLFDLRHGWVNLRGLVNYLTGGSADEIRNIMGVPPWSFWSSFEFFTKTLYAVISPLFVQYLPFSLSLTAVLITILAIKKTLKKEQYFLLGLILFALLFSSFYKGYLADYYFIFIFPLPIILFSSLAVDIFEKGLVRSALLVFLVSGLCLFNIKRVNFEKTERNLDKITNIAGAIAKDSKQDGKFNLFLKRETPFWSTASEYRYLVEIFGKKALGPTEYNQAEYLYFIDETAESQPLQVKNWEITEFNPGEIIRTWQTDKVIIYKLNKKDVDRN